MRLDEGELRETVIATDGSCSRNGERDAQAGAGIYVEENHPLNRSVRLPKNIDQSNQTGEVVATYLASTIPDPRVNIVQETDSRTTMEALTKHRQKHEDSGFITTKNGALISATIAALRNRKAHTAFNWVKGHNGHPRNEGADRLAGLGAEKPQEGDPGLNVDTPSALRVTGAMLWTVSQKLAYTAIRQKKTQITPPRPSTATNLGVIEGELEAACNFKVRREAIWLSLRKPEVTRECRQFIWRAIHDAFMIGRHWLRNSMPDMLRERATCKVCLETESMDHILFRCNAIGSRRVKRLLKDLWSHTGTPWPGFNWGTALGAACVVFKSQKDKRLTNRERLWTILATEAVYLIWKLRCERVIQNDGREFTNVEVENKWFATINRRLALERWMTAPFLEKKAKDPEVVEETWWDILDNTNNLPPNWVGDGGVLVGIKRGR
ncbi:RnaseH-domain-containing protein [Cubamyces sp. BRFM 1775]|nr:RnaseH-domain-containing protein [Cubamyces sp. BRFM 1775]